MNGKIRGVKEPLVGSVEIDAVSKRFRKHTLTKKTYTTVKTSLIARFFRKKFHEGNFIQALSSVSLSIPSGSAIGIIGRNGSGKSTLLKLISGIYRPDSGQVKVNGRISALIELGAGFHPDFTGRENVYLGGVMYGLTRKEIQSRFDQIVSYAGLSDFIDDPVRTYSSGMYMRLGFSLAVHTDPDILLVDEVLAVGDAAFVGRCHETISEFKRQGKTLILVTHDLNAVERWCNEAVWLEKGVVRKKGEPREVIDTYLQKIHEEEEISLEVENALRSREALSTEEVSTGLGKRRWGSREVEITDVRMSTSSGQVRWLFNEEDEVLIEVDYTFHKKETDLVFGIGILHADGMCLFGTNTEIENIAVPIPQFEKSSSSEMQKLSGTFRYKIKRLGLVEGNYYLDVACHKKDGYPYDYHHRLHKFTIRSISGYHGVFSPEHSWSFAPKYPFQEHETNIPRSELLIKGVG